MLDVTWQVQRDYEELPAGAIGNLRISLADLLAHFGKGPSSVRTQLALAIAGARACMHMQVGGGQACAWGEGLFKRHKEEGEGESKRG